MPYPDLQDVEKLRLKLILCLKLLHRYQLKQIHHSIYAIHRQWALNFAL